MNFFTPRPATLPLLASSFTTMVVRVEPVAGSGDGSGTGDSPETSAASADRLHCIHVGD